MTHAGRKLAWAGLLCLAVLSGCSKTSEDPLSRTLPLLGPLVGLGDEKPAPPQKKITRAQLNAVPFATISLARETEPDRISYIVAVANNNGYVTYQQTSGSSVVLFGNLLTSTNGLGLDLAAVKHQVDDPIARQTPVLDWPGVVTRNYQFSLASRPNYEITVVCTLSIVARERIEVIELFFDVTRVAETCKSPRREFTNTYWVGEDGQVWQSEQWVGPEQGKFIVQTIRPFGG